MGQFSPVQLDGLEDALEDLELAGIPAEFEDDAAVSDRLSEYRKLLQFSREALPSVEVPTGVLDSVLAAAREEAEAPAVGAALGTEDAPVESAESKTPWWKRLSMWVPALAVAASAALVLVMVQGTLSDDAPESAVASAEAPPSKASKSGALLEQGEALQAAAEPLADADEEGERFGDGASQSRGRLRGSAALDRAKDEVDAEIEAEEEAPAEMTPSAPPADSKPTDTTDKIIYDKEKGVSPERAKERSNAKPSNASGKKQAAPRPMPQPGASPKAKPDAKAPGGGAAVADPAKALSTADQSRREGRCSRARTVYRGLEDHPQAKVRARALAGLGLCALSDGDDKGADAYFSRARGADNGIGSFISRERDATEQSPQQAL